MATQIGYSFQWKIENRSDNWWLRKGEVLESPKFVADALGGTKWTLMLYPMGGKDGNYVGLYLCRKFGGGPNVIEVNYKMALLGEDESVLREFTVTKKSFNKDQNWGFPKYEERKTVFVDERKTFLPEDTLTVQCTIWNKEEPTEPKLICVRTVFKEYRRSFVWKIDKCSCLEHGVGNKFKERLIDFDLVLSEEDFQHKLCLNINEFDGRITYFSLKTSIIDGEGKIKISQTLEYLADDLKKGEFSAPIFTEKLMAKENLYFPNGVLSLDCESVVWIQCVSYENSKAGIYPEFTNANKVVESIDEHNAVEEESPDTLVLVKDLKSMYIDAIFCDAEIRTSTQTFPVHKSVLSARSPVFLNMFSHDWMEKNIEHLDITDLENDTIHRMLLYLYTGSLADLQLEGAISLYRIAYKFEILPLKMKCSSFLKDNLCPTSACEALDVADLSNDEDMKRYVVNYILEQPKQFFRSHKWKEFMKTHHDLAQDVMYKKICND